MKYFLITFLLISSSAFASKLSMFNSSIKTFLLLDFSHLLEVEKEITIRPPRLYEKWLMEKTMAQATYNDILNTIVLYDDNFIFDGTQKRVKSFYDFKAQQRFTFISNASTIFHELSHADYDVFVEETPGYWRDFFTKELIPWLKSNVDYRYAKDINHELFGYTAGDSLLGLQFEVSDILFAHGYNYVNEKCLSESIIRKVYERMGRPSEVMFIEDERDYSYAKKFIPHNVFVRGKDFNVEKAGLPPVYKTKLYKYFVEKYSFPKTKNDLIYKLNQSHFLDKIQKCFEIVREK